jgi:hypothetical protein
MQLEQKRRRGAGGSAKVCSSRKNKEFYGNEKE